jgi:hypothetical protein
MFQIARVMLSRVGNKQPQNVDAYNKHDKNDQVVAGIFFDKCCQGVV